MNLNELLGSKGIEPRQVLVLRHRPWEREFNKVLPFIAAEKPDWFNAYQQTQGEKLEKAMTQAGYVASFIGHEPGEALFIGLYKIGASKPLTYAEYWEVPAYKTRVSRASRFSSSVQGASITSTQQMIRGSSKHGPFRIKRQPPQLAASSSDNEQGNN
jgi:hypothetical protein